MHNDQMEFNIGDGEDPATVEMNEDGTEAKLADAPQPPDVAVEDKAEPKQQAQELDKYTDSVQKRIDKLTARLRETERREAAALEYARSVQQKAQELEQQYHQTDSARLTEAKSRIETQAAALAAVIRQAREEGDIETEMEAQRRLTKITMDQERVEAASAQREHQQAMREAQQQRAAQQPQAPQQQPRRAPDIKAEEWAERNEWYGTDLVMTQAVQGVHYQLVVNEQFDPTSDEYYDELDRRMSEYFPHKLGQPAQQQQQQSRSNRPAHPVAPASRPQGGKPNARRTVKLTPSQVAIAKKLGVPLEEYAKYVKE